MKKLSLMIAGLLASSQIYALGLGQPQLHSHLGEPLQVSIPLLLSAEERSTLSKLRASVGDQAMFTRMDMAFRENFRQISVTLERRGQDAWLMLKTESRVNEPLLEFPLDVSLGGNRLVRGLTLLMDPPGLKLPAAPMASPSVVTNTSSRTPSTTETTRPTAAPAATVRPANAQGQRSNGSYGPVGINQTLGEIAQQLRPDGASLHQTLVALWQANPDAFLQNNMNRLMAGSTLSIPDDQTVLALDPVQARRQVVVQYQSLRTGAVSVQTARPKVEVAPEPVTTQVPPATVLAEPAEAAEPVLRSPETPSTATDEPRLSLLAPSNIEQIPEVLQDEVKLLTGRLRTLDDENQELRERIAGLEKHIDSLSRQMVILAENTLALSTTEAERLASVMDQLDVSEEPAAREVTTTSTQEESSPVTEERDMANLDQTLAPPVEEAAKESSNWWRYLLIGGALVVTLGVAAIWFRRLRQRERYREIMYRF